MKQNSRFQIPNSDLGMVYRQVSDQRSVSSIDPTVDVFPLRPFARPLRSFAVKYRPRLIQRAMYRTGPLTAKERKGLAKGRKGKTSTVGSIELTDR